MALTEIPVELSSTPGIADSSNATAITIDSSENTNLSGSLVIHGDADTATNAQSGSVGIMLYASGDTAYVTSTSNGNSHRYLELSAINSGTRNDNQLFLSYVDKQIGMGTNSPDDNSFGTGHGVLAVASATGSAKTAMLNLMGDGNDTDATRVSSIFFNDQSATGAGKSLAGIEAYRASNHATDPGGDLLFSTNASGGSYTERMRIDSDGKVGIGAASSGDDLHVTNSSTSCNIRASGENNINRKVQIGYDASAGPYVQGGSSGINTLKFYVDNTSLAMTIAANDEISGDFNDTSDVALKENIVDLESAIEKLKQLKPRIFDWKNPDKEKGVGGFIAQEVETVIPKAVVGNDYVADTYYEDGDTIPDGKEIGDLKTAGDPGKAVNTSAILAYAVKAIQELEAKVKALEEA